MSPVQKLYIQSKVFRIFWCQNFFYNIQITEYGLFGKVAQKLAKFFGEFCKIKFAQQLKKQPKWQNSAQSGRTVTSMQHRDRSIHDLYGMQAEKFAALSSQRSQLLRSLWLCTPRSHTYAYVRTRGGSGANPMKHIRVYLRAYFTSDQLKLIL